MASSNNILPRMNRSMRGSNAGEAASSIGTTSGMQSMLLRQQVAQAIEKAGWVSVLIMLDVMLSLLSVVLYIVMTYRVAVQVCYDIDLALAVFFSLNWVFWFWLAENRVAYVFSLMSAIDAVTIIPAFVLYALEGELSHAVPGLNFLRVLRILRVLRVFRMKHVMSRHLEGAVTEAAGKLVFSLLSMLFIAAGLFYELESYGPDREDKIEGLTFLQSLYWAAVTLTTVGYGDLSPTYWATQLMLIVLLMATFTLLPYLTGQLMDALTSSSPYQRARFKASSRRDAAGHVVFLGAIDGPTLSGLLDEFYHEDKGFNHQSAVFLCPQPPSLDVQHVLATHHASPKLKYLQGSPFRAEDLNRTCVEYASAVFIIAPKHATDPLLADRHTVMMALALGQYLQEAHVALLERLSYTPNKIMHWLQHGHVFPPRSLPSIFIQVVLPEGRVRLYQILQSLQERTHNSGARASKGSASGDHKPVAYSTAVAAAVAAADAARAAAAAAGGNGSQGQQVPAAAGAGRGCDDSANVSPFVSAAGAAFDTYSSLSGELPGSAVPGSSQSAAAAAQQKAAKTAAAAAATAKTWDQQQAAAIGQAAAAAAGRGSVNSVDVQNMPTGAAYWKLYASSIHVMCLGDLRHALMAHSLAGVPGVITLLSNLSATVDFGVDALEQNKSLPSWLCAYMAGASQELYELAEFPAMLLGQSFRTAAGFMFDACHAVLLATDEGQGSLRIADLDQTIEPDMRGYIIADDISSVITILSATPEDFNTWQDRRRQQQQRLQQQQMHSAVQPPPTQLPKLDSATAADAPAAAEPGFSGQAEAAAVTVQQQQQQQQDSHRARHDWRSLSRRAAPAAAAAAAGSGTLTASDSLKWNLQGQHKRSKGKLHVMLPRHKTQHQSSFNSQTWLGDDSEDWLFESSLEDGTAAGATAAAGPAGILSSGPSVGTAAAAKAAVAAVDNAIDTAPKHRAGHSAALAAVIHLLRSPSRQLRQHGEAYMRQHYHLRREGAVQSSQDIVLDCVPQSLSGHCLVVGLPRSQEALLALLAPLRSRRLAQWRPIVIVDSSLPGSCGCWNTLAQFKDTYFIQQCGGLNDALLRANAESAAQAALLTPLSAQEGETGDVKLASKVMTDAMIVHMYQLLKSLNPSMQIITELMLPQNMAYLAPMAPMRSVPRSQQPMLSPAFMSGAVFMSQLIDDLMIASYCNSVSDKIVLQLLQRWHMCGEGINLRRLQQQRQQQQQQAVMPFDVDLGMDQSQGGSLAQQQQQQQRSVRFAGDGRGDPRDEDSLGAARAGSSSFGPVSGGGDAAASGSSQIGPPAILQIAVDVSVAPGLTYGRYFHQLLNEEGLLLLGLYRLVQDRGHSFRAAITNPRHSTHMRPDDYAFVVATLPFPESFDSPAAAAAAWPPGMLGFNNLDPPVHSTNDLLTEPQHLNPGTLQPQPGPDPVMDFLPSLVELQTGPNRAELQTLEEFRPDSAADQGSGVSTWGSIPAPARAAALAAAARGPEGIGASTAQSEAAAAAASASGGAGGFVGGGLSSHIAGVMGGLLAGVRGRDLTSSVGAASTAAAVFGPAAGDVSGLDGAERAGVKSAPAGGGGVSPRSAYKRPGISSPISPTTGSFSSMGSTPFARAQNGMPSGSQQRSHNPAAAAADDGAAGEMYAPAGAGSSGNVGPGVGDVPQGEVLGHHRRMTVLKVPGLTTAYFRPGPERPGSFRQQQQQQQEEELHGDRAQKQGSRRGTFLDDII